LPEDEQTSKNWGGGRYNAILKFKWEQIKKLRKRKKEKYICMRKKEKKYEYEKK
jgi:hypothetical protein